MKHLRGMCQWGTKVRGNLQAQTVVLPKLTSINTHQDPMSKSSRCLMAQTDSFKKPGNEADEQDPPPNIASK